MSRLGRILQALASSGTGGSLVKAICPTAMEIVGVDGAGLSLLSDGQRGQISTHGSFAAEGEDLQFSLGEGPSNDAFASDVLVEATNLGPEGDVRWPMFSQAMSEAGVRSVASFPLRIGGARFGALTLYRSASGELSAEQVGDAYLVAQVGAYLIVAAQAQVGEESVIGEIEAGFVRMEPVHQATGMIMAHLGLSPGDAMARLRAAAYGAGRSVTEVAIDIVAGHLALSQDT